mmetsp:Transcript_22874/g.68400  ORF Transcript_22874/g.68400 Transcript_22874/m.68400 type:complete len:304 (-) Transcript_22874:230-1141(-)
MRPSTIAAPPQPLFTACTAVWSFGIMPPLMMPSLTSASAELGVMRWMSSMFASRTPVTSVRRRRRDAFNASATAPAAVSAFTENVSPFRPAAIGATTGMRPSSSTSLRSFALTSAGSPTKPRSTISTTLPFSFRRSLTSLSATIKESSLPDKPNARPPRREIAAEICLLIDPHRTISDTFTVAASVTRNPSMNCDVVFNLLSMSPICGPPPWTTTGLTPSFCINTMSCAKHSAARSSDIAWPPYLTTTHNPECCEKHSSASKIFVPSRPPAVIPTLDGGRIVVCGGTRAVAAVSSRSVRMLGA